jgi:hypothetical protein
VLAQAERVAADHGFPTSAPEEAEAPRSDAESDLPGDAPADASELDEDTLEREHVN